MFAKLVAAVPLLAAVANAAQHQVLVGMNGTLTFSPSSISADKNDTVQFVFMSKNHTIQQSNFTDPCTQLSGGFSAPFNQAVKANQTDNFPTLEISVDVQTPLWIVCPQPGPPDHCKQGMVFAINPTQDKTFEAFQQNAINSANPSVGSASTNGSGTSIISNNSSSSSSSGSNNGSGSTNGSGSGSGSNNGSGSGNTGAATHFKVSAAMGLLGVVASGMLLL